jgi:hypothetical protein
MEGDTMNNVVPLGKRRKRTLNSSGALQHLREAGGESATFEVASISELARILGWERTRASKALKRWERKGQVTTATDPDTGKISIHVLSDRQGKERSKGTGISRVKIAGKKRSKTRENDREKSPLETGENPRLDPRENAPRVTREVVQNSPELSTFSPRSEIPQQATSAAPPTASATPPFATPEETPMSTATEAFPATAETSSVPAPERLPEYASQRAQREVVQHAVRGRIRQRDGRGGYDPDRQSLSLMDVLVILACISLTGVAAVLSVNGMIVLFPGIPVIAVWLGGTLEGAKLLCAGWLGRIWGDIGWAHRLLLIGFTSGVAVICAVGVYSQLVASHLSIRGAAQAAYETRDAEAGGRIELASGRIADLDTRIRQIDLAVEGAAQRGRSKTAISTMQSQQRQRAALVAERDQARKELASLKTDRTTGSAQYRAQEAEAAPIKYVAELLGVQRGGEEIIRWLVAGIVAVTDPFALALSSALASRRRRRNGYFESFGSLGQAADRGAFL